MSTTTLSAPLVRAIDLRSLKALLQAFFARKPTAESGHVDVWSSGARGL